MVYADHKGFRTDDPRFSSPWIDLFEEWQEEACRRYGRGAAFVVEATHDTVRSYERKPES